MLFVEFTRAFCYWNAVDAIDKNASKSSRKPSLTLVKAHATLIIRAVMLIYNAIVWRIYKLPYVISIS